MMVKEMSGYEFIKELNKRASEIKKKLTKEMIKNTDARKKLKADYAELYKSTKYPQEFISVLSARFAHQSMD